MYLSVVIPCFNEEERIEKTLDAICDHLGKQSYQSEIIVVDNGSNDETPEILLAFAKNNPMLKIINRHSHGKGYAVRAGMLTAATGEYRLFTDADNSTDIKQVDLLLEWAKKGYDVVISSRKIEGAVITNPQPPLRVLLGNLFQLLVKVIVPLGIKDTQNGFKLFTKEATERIFIHQTVFYWAFDVELLALARKLKMKIIEVPIIWVDDNRSSMSLKGMTRMLFEILSIRIRLWTSTFKK